MKRAKKTNSRGSIFNLICNGKEVDQTYRCSPRLHTSNRQKVALDHLLSGARVVMLMLR